jgi:hypothetical protein
VQKTHTLEIHPAKVYDENKRTDNIDSVNDMQKEKVGNTDDVEDNEIIETAFT